MEAIERYITHQNWITLTLIIIGVAIALAHFSDRKRLKSLFILIFNKFYFSDFNFSSGDLLKWFNILLLIVSILTLGLLTMKINDVTGILNAKSSVFLFLKLIGFISVFLIIKYIIEQTLAKIFKIGTWYQTFAYVKTSYFLGFHLIFLLVLIPSLYYFKDNATYIYFTGIIYVILLILRYIHVFNYFSKVLTSFLFYFILYLCILEIAPFILMYKWVI